MKQKEFFFGLYESIKSFSLDENPHWLTAIATRVFWSISNSQGFTEAVEKKINKKLNKIKKPSILVRVISGVQLNRIKKMQIK